MTSSLRGAVRRILRLQFGLRFLFALTLFAAAWMGVIVHRTREAHTAVTAIYQHGGHVCYAFQESPPGSGRYDPKAKPHLPQFLITKLGEDFFYDVVVVSLSDGAKPKTRRDIAASPQPPSHYLPALREVRHLFCGETRMNDFAFSFVGRLKNLETLEAFDANGVTDAGIDHLADLRKLRVIALLLGSSVTDESFQTLAGLPLLERLELPGAHITDRGLSYLRGLTKLRQLGLGGGRGAITDRGLESLGVMPRLEYLDLSDANITAVGLSRLGKLSRLRYLDLSNNRVLGDDAARLIAEFSGLEELNLSNTKLTSNGVGELARLKNLRVLDLSENSGIDERAVAHLPELAAISDLDLHNTKTRITEASAVGLAQIRSLRFLNLAGTGSNTRAVKTALPGCQVIGSSSGEPDGPGFDAGTDLYSVILELQSWELSRQAIEMAQAGFKCEEITSDYIPSTEILSPKETLRRMIELTKIAGLGEEFAKQRKVLEQLENRVDPLQDGVSSRDELATNEHSRCIGSA